MRIVFALAIATIATSACLAGTPVPTPTPVVLNVSGNAVPITTVLDLLARQTGATIVYDYTVKDTLGDSHIKLASLDAMFAFLQAKDAGLTIQSLYLPADKPIPTGVELVGLVNALKQIQSNGLVVVGKDDNTTITFSKGNAPAAAPPGMKLVYLVTNEAMRVQLAADEAAQQRVAAAAAQARAGLGQQPAYMNPQTSYQQALARQQYLNQMRAVQAAAARQRQQQQNQPTTIGGMVITPN